MKHLPKIIRNAARCRKCGVTIESKHTHDYQECGCPAHVMVDGGKEYIRRGWDGNVGKYDDCVEDLSEFEGDE